MIAKNEAKDDNKGKKIAKQKTASKKKTVKKTAKKGVNTKKGILTQAQKNKLKTKLKQDREKLKQRIIVAKLEKPKIIRDPIHDIIIIDNKLVIDLVNSKPMQRLRRIRQLGNTSIVFPGAEHSRFAHSLGVYHLSRVMIDHLNMNNSGLINPYDSFVVQVAALLHDVGHGPFSHLFEQALDNIKYRTPNDRNYEEWTKKIIKENSELNSIIERHLGGQKDLFKQDVIDIINKKYYKPALFTIVSSQFDVDRFDYMLRDSHMTGVNYGSIDLNWLLYNLHMRKSKIKQNSDEAKQEEENKIVFNKRRGLSALHEYILGNFHLYKNVYLHKTIQAADSMIISMLTRALDLLEESNNEQKKTKLGFGNATLLKISDKEEISTEEYLALDDNVIFSWVNKWASDSTIDNILHDLSNKFLSRKLFKTIDLNEIFQGKGKKLRSFFPKLFEKIGFESRYYTIDSEPVRTAYKPINAQQIFYINDESDSNPKPLSELPNQPDSDEVSKAIINGLEFSKNYIVYDYKYDDIINTTIQEVLG